MRRLRFMPVLAVHVTLDYSPHPTTVICRILIKGRIQSQFQYSGTVIGWGLYPKLHSV